jgi:response regulator RpfG family c-di-GMP phosphodiesterase
MKKLQNKITILLIENNSVWLAGVNSVLREAGYNVLIAEGGDQGFCTAKRVQPDLIISESALPDISGIRLCYMIRADKNLHTGLFVLMGDAGGQSSDIAYEAIRAGADDFFDENCSHRFLAAKITQLITLQRSETELRQRCQNLSRSERQLTQIVEDTCNLVAALDPVFRFVASDDYETSDFREVCAKSAEIKKRMPKKNADIAGGRNQEPRAGEIINSDWSGSENRRKIYYKDFC